MKRLQHFNLFDLILFISVGAFLLSCVFTSLQTARTREPGQAEISAGYMQLRSIEEFSEDPMQLIGINARMGIVDNFDAGIAHSFDVTKDNENIGNTLWGDVKYQFSNKANENQKLTFSSGLIKGYVYDNEVQSHITSVPFYFSVPVNNRFTPTFLYRYRLASENFFPNSDSFDNANHLFAVGLEYYLKEPDPMRWIPKFAFSIGTLQDFGDSEDSGLLLFNFGLKIDSPFGNK